MRNDADETINVSHFKFIGKILSVFTHELNNHLAIIKESAGLMEDILSLQKPSQQQAIEESLKIANSIGAQINKTSWLCKQLNNFGHRMDNTYSAFNVNKTLEELLILINRSANQSKINFAKDFQEDIPSIYNNPAKLQFLIFCLVDSYLKQLSKDSTIVFKTSHKDKAVKISIIPEGRFIEAYEANICPDDLHQHIVTKLEGNMAVYERGAVITLPLSVATGAKMPE
ncbi:MAG: HAMP domain-containing histidine kinase [Nitrospirae bacterium]|nr:HAMP domain-containing histidine kinase [Nitrospirota bacterium]